MVDEFEFPKLNWLVVLLGLRSGCRRASSSLRRMQWIVLPIRGVVDIPWNSDRSRARNVLPSGIRMRRCCRMVGSRILQYGLRPCDGSRLERLIMVWLGRVSSCNVGLLVWHFLSVSLPIRRLGETWARLPILGWGFKLV